jgi:hypothetical protein
MPSAFNMFSRAPKGATMIASFKPYMTQARLDGYQIELREIGAGIHEAVATVPARLTPGATPAAATSRFDAAFPDIADFATQWRTAGPAMTGLLDTVQANLGNYLAVAALPRFSLFPWFFVLPGVILLALLGAYLIRPRWWRGLRWAVAVLGVGLVLAPAAFQMFDRAPKGGQMMTAFKSIETTSNIQRVQGYFGSIASGQGAIALQIVPALEKSGLAPSSVAASYPAITTLDGQWVHILNDMTPMIGAMSDNVPTYQAVAALPPFPLFPWFFVLPGLLIAALAVAAGPRRRAAPAPLE